MFCRNCGKELTGTPEFCMNCGAKPMTGTNFCPGCGAPTTALTEVCTNCGARAAKAIKKKTWKPTAAGILCITLGAIVVVILGIMLAAGLASPAPSNGDPFGYLVMIFFGGPSIILGIVAIVGGIYALRRRVWGLALAGSIALVGLTGWGILRIFPFVGFGILGILAIVFVSLGKREFK